MFNEKKIFYKKKLVTYIFVKKQIVNIFANGFVNKFFTQ